MKIGVFPADHSGCGSYRLIFPAQAIQLMKPELDITIHPAGRIDDLGVVTGHNPATGRRRVVIAERPPFDVIIIQRPASYRFAGAIPLWRDQGVKVVVDLDDDLGALDPAHSGYAGYHPRLSINENWQLLAQAVASADRVVVTTRRLAERYGTNVDCRIVRNCIPRHYLDIEADKLPNRLSWTGTTLTHPGDLRVVGSAVAKVLRARPDWRFRVVGPGDGVGRDLGILPAAIESTGWVSLLDYPAAMAQSTVGIVPLVLNGFNQAKSWLKLLEFSALGVPCVASGTDPNLLLSFEGAGVIAETPNQWHARLADLMDDPALRVEMAAKGRAVAADHTIEGNWREWFDAWCVW